MKIIDKKIWIIILSIIVAIVLFWIGIKYSGQKTGIGQQNIITEKQDGEYSKIKTPVSELNEEDNGKEQKNFEGEGKKSSDENVKQEKNGMGSQTNQKGNTGEVDKEQTYELPVDKDTAEQNSSAQHKNAKKKTTAASTNSKKETDAAVSSGRRSETKTADSSEDKKKTDTVTYSGNKKDTENRQMEEYELPIVLEE